MSAFALGAPTGVLVHADAGRNNGFANNSPNANGSRSSSVKALSDMIASLVGSRAHNTPPPEPEKPAVGKAKRRKAKGQAAAKAAKPPAAAAPVAPPSAPVANPAAAASPQKPPAASPAPRGRPRSTPRSLSPIKARRPAQSIVSSMAAPRGGSLLRRFEAAPPAAAPAAGLSAPTQPEIPSAFPPRAPSPAPPEAPPAPPPYAPPAPPVPVSQLPVAAPPAPLSLPTPTLAPPAPPAPPAPQPAPPAAPPPAMPAAASLPPPALAATILQQAATQAAVRPPSPQPPSPAPRKKAGRRRRAARAAEGAETLTPYECILRDAAQIEAKLAYRFRDKHLLALAFVHSSSAGGQGLQHPLKPMLNNERLEFIGDAVFGLIIADHLYRTLPYADEGEITRLRAHLVCGEACARYLERLRVAEHLQATSGRGSERARASLAADLFEAILGAIYLDSGGTDVPEWFLLHHFAPDFEAMIASPPRNWKAELQEHTQRHLRRTPEYVDLGSEPVPGAVEAAREWHVGVRAGPAPDGGEEGPLLGRGKGATKKQAQQRAAWDALVALGVIEAPPLPELPPVADVMGPAGTPALDGTAAGPAASPAELASGFSCAPHAWARRRRRWEGASGPHRAADVVEVARAVAGVLVGSAEAHDRAGAVPHDALAELKASGLPLLPVPLESGGWGCPLDEALAAVEALAEADAAVALALAAHCAALAALLHEPAARFPDAAMRHLLAAVVERGALAGRARGPPGAGREGPLGPLRAGASCGPDGALLHWTLSGEAAECALGPALDYILVDLQAGPAAPGPGPDGPAAAPRVRALVARAPGVQCAEGPAAMGLRALGPYRLLLRSVRLEPDAVAALARPDPVPLGSAEAVWERALTAAAPLGIATAAVRAACEHLAAADGPPPDFALRLLGEASVAREQARCGLHAAVAAWRRAPAPPAGAEAGGSWEREEAGAAVLAAAEAAAEGALRVVQLAARVVGLAALRRGAALERLLRDAHACRALLPEEGGALEALGRAQLELLAGAAEGAAGDPEAAPEP